MAGLGYKSFSAGDVLTAAQVQGYLQDQAVMRFADSTARATAIGTANFTEGMISYLDNTNQVEYYSGSAWASVAPADTAGLVHINTTTFSAQSSVSFPADIFTSTYKNYRLVANVTQTSSGVLSIRWRTSGTDNTASTYYDYFAKSGTNSATFASNYNNGGTSSYFSDNTSGTDSLKAFGLDIFSPKEAQRTYYSGNVVTSANSAGQPYYGGFVFGGFNNTTAFDSMTLFPVSGTITGSMTIFAYKN